MQNNKTRIKRALYLSVLSVEVFFIPTPLVGGGEELYTQMGFFCSVNFGRSIYSWRRNLSGIIKKMVKRRIQNKKDFLDFRLFFRGVIED